MVNSRRTTKAITLGLVVAILFIAATLAVPATANTVDLPDTTGDVGLYPSIALKPNGLATVAYYDATNKDLKVRNCTDVACAPGTGTTQTLNSTADIGNDVGLNPSMVLEPFTGKPVIAYFDATNGSLRLARCTNISCSNATLTTVDPAASALESVGRHSSLQLDALGNPVIAYSFQRIVSVLPPVVEREIRLVHCNDPLCATGGDTIEVISDSGGRPSLALNASGFPVVSVSTQNGFWPVIFVRTCSDVNCSGSVTLNGAFGPIGQTSGVFADMELDSSGFPVIAFGGNGTLGLLHCNDPLCAGDDESFAFPGPTGDVGQGVSMELDASGNPVISYHRFDGINEVRILRCLDPNCGGAGYLTSRPVDADANLAGDDAVQTSLALDDSGLPVFATYEATNDDLRVVRCDDLACTRTFYVDHTAFLGANSGESWDDAFLNPQQAVAAAQSGEIIRIAEGTYRPGAVGDRTSSFDFSGLTVVGGYSSGGSSEPDGAANPTVLSGDLGDNDTSAAIGHASRSENSFHVVRTASSIFPTVLSHVIIGSGNANGAGDDSIAAGIVAGGDIRLENVTVAANTATSAAGVNVRDGAHLEVRDSSIRDNAASASGAGVGIDFGSSADFVSVLLASNVSGGAGGAINNFGDTTIVRSTIFANRANTGGGVASVGSLTLTNDLFSLNSSTLNGGAIWDGGTGTLDNITIANNSAGGSGGAVYGITNTTMFNSVVWDSGATPLAGAGLFAHYSTVEGGHPGTANSSIDPLFVNATGFNFRLSTGSSAIDSGFNLNVPVDHLDVDDDGSYSEPTPDLDLAQRIVGGTVDRGAYENPDSPQGLTVLGGPCVVYDSFGAGELPFVGGESREVQVTGVLSGQGGAGLCVPVGASSVVFGISSIDPLTEGNLVLTPAGVTATGSAGVVNYGESNGLDNANTVTVPVSADGAVDIGANAGPAGAAPTTNVRLIAIGYYSPDVDPDLKFFPLNPCAVADSRTGQGADNSFDGPANDGLWPVGSAFPDIDVAGTFPAGQGGANTDCGVPTSADAVMVNVVAVNMQGGSGHLSVGTGDIDPTNEATTPFAVLTPKMNNGASTIVNVGPGGTIAVDIDGDVGASTMIRVEILGYYDNDVAGLDFFDVTPCAVFDTRTGQGATGSFEGLRLHGSTNTTTYQVSGESVPVGQGGVVDSGGGVGGCEVPTGAKAVLINLEAVNAVREGNFWVSAEGTATTGGVLNFNAVLPKMNNANAVVVPLSTAGQLNLEINAGSFTTPGTAVAHARGVILGYYN